jgi:hypothetical protein
MATDVPTSPMDAVGDASGAWLLERPFRANSF